jgi:hypothetical protein
MDVYYKFIKLKVYMSIDWEQQFSQGKAITKYWPNVGYRGSNSRQGIGASIQLETLYNLKSI